MSAKAKTIHGLTHKELVRIANRWLRNTKKCSVVLSEMVSQSEVPDAIGWKSRMSTLIECKSTRKSFAADKKKRCRRILDGEYAFAFGMGNFRYYMVPEGMIDRCEVPIGWGLLEVTFTGRVKRTVDSTLWVLPSTELGHEMGLLLSALRRYQVRELKKESRK